MNKNKGIIGIGLIIAIILGIIVIGGGVYYFGNGSSKQQVKVEENKSINTEVKNNISMLLPTPYISSNNWPPIINRYPTAYSCEPNPLTKSSGEMSSVTEQIIINGKKYCKITESNYGMNHWNNRYLYVMTNGNDTRIMSINLVKANCDVYGSSLNGGDKEYKKCQTDESNFDLDKIADSLFTIDSLVTIPACSANGITVTFPKNDFECYYDNANSLNISYNNGAVKMNIYKFNNQYSFNESLPYSPEYESVDMNYSVNDMPAQYYKNFKGDEGGSTIIIPSKFIKINMPIWKMTEMIQPLYDQIIASIKIN